MNFFLPKAIKYPAILILLSLLLCSGCLFAQKPQFDKQLMDYSLAKQYAEEGKFEEAASLLEVLTDKNFKDEYYKLLMSVYKEMNDKKRQEKLIKKAVKKDRDNLRYMIDLGTFYIDNNEEAKGIKQYENVLDNLKADNSLIVSTAEYFAQIRNYDYSARTYQKARKIFNDELRYTYELTSVYQMLGRNDEIAREYLLLLEKIPKMLNQIEVNINNLFNRDKDDKLYSVFSDVVLEEVKKKPDNKEVNLLYYWLQLQKGDYASAFVQAKAMDKRFREVGFKTLNDFAVVASNAGQYKYALDAYGYILKQNPEKSLQDRIQRQRLMCLYNQFIQKPKHTDRETADLKKEYEELLSLQGYNAETAPVMQQYANLLAYHLQQPQQAVDLLDTIINIRQLNNKTKAECKLTRGDIYLINGDIWEASLTYSQVDKDMKNETMGSEAKFRNAMLSYYTGDFDWALSQFDALRSSTSKLIANDAMEYSLLIKENMDKDSTYKGLAWFSKADFALYQNKIKEAETYLDSIENWYSYHSLFDEVLYKRAQIAIKEKNYHKADSLLHEIIQKYPYDLTADDAIMLSARINEEYFGDKEKAKQYYGRLIIDYPSSLYIQQARKKYKEYEQTQH